MGFYDFKLFDYKVNVNINRILIQQMSVLCNFFMGNLCLIEYWFFFIKQFLNYFYFRNKYLLYSMLIFCFFFNLVVIEWMFMLGYDIRSFALDVFYIGEIRFKKKDTDFLFFLIFLVFECIFF